MLMYFSRIVDLLYTFEHALRLFREEETGVCRLQASVLKGNLERTPVWTAFVTTQIRTPGWASRNSKRVVLPDIEPFFFTNNYSASKTSKDKFELTFVDARGIALVIPLVLVHLLIRSSDALHFMNAIDELQHTQGIQ